MLLAVLLAVLLAAFLPGSYEAQGHQPPKPSQPTSRAFFPAAIFADILQEHRYKRAQVRSGDGPMTRDEKLRLAVSVARAAARSGEYRKLDKLIELVFRKLDELSPSVDEDEAERGFKL